MIEMSHNTNPEYAKLQLIREIPEYSNTTCLQIAKLARDLNFLSQTCVQELLGQLWYNKIAKETTTFRV